MKKLCFLFLISVTLSANPEWFYNLEYDKKSEIVGYGMDAKLSNAKQNAISDITQAISISVKSSVNIYTSDVKGELQQDSSINLKTTSQAVLSGVEFIRAQKIKGIWYVAAKYDNSPLEIKLKKLLPANLEDEIQNRYLKGTPLVSGLNDDVGKRLDYKVVRKDNLWQLKYKDVLVPFSSEEDFYKLFSNQSSDKISIKANQSIYKENDTMYFNIKHPKSGYVSILYVEHNGKVGVLLANQKSNQSFTYPDLRSKELFKIANPYNKTIKELYIALYSDTPLDLHDFENVSEDLLDESNYTFSKLLSMLNHSDFSTFIIKIR